jgi:hypothetical protein
VARRPQPPAQKKKRPKAQRRALPLDAMASEMLKLLMRAFIRRGHSIDDIVRHCEAAGRQYQPSMDPQSDAQGISRDDWVQIMYTWSSDPNYVGAEGQPRPLPIDGPAPSLEALHQRVGSKRTLMEVCHQMVATGAARMEETHLVAVANAPIVFPAGSAEQNDHHLHFLHSALLNVEHNAAPQQAERWVERLAICHRFPESALGAYSNSAKKHAQDFLTIETANMHRIATSSGTSDHTVEAMLHVFFSARKTERLVAETADLSEGASKPKDSLEVGGPRKSTS